MQETPYLLGTHTEELERLRFQHTLWRPIAQAAWQRACLQKGQSVLDLGAGPGFAAADLADVVGAEGRVLGLERSEAYVAAGRRMAEQPACTNWNCANRICSAILGRRNPLIWCGAAGWPCFYPSWNPS